MLFRSFFAAVLKSQPHLLTGWKSKLWCRFFLLSVFVTMYLNDLQRAGFYSSIGLDAKKFDIHVIRKTNQSSAKLFPVILDVENPLFLEYLEECSKNNLEFLDIDKKDINYIQKIIQKSFKLITIFTILIKLYLLKPIDTESQWKTVF